MKGHWARPTVAFVKFQFVGRAVPAPNSGLAGLQSAKDHWARRQRPKVKFQLIGLSGEAASAPAFMRGLAKIFDF